MVDLYQNICRGELLSYKLNCLYEMPVSFNEGETKVSRNRRRAMQPHAAKARNSIKSVQNQSGLKHYIEKDPAPCSLTPLPPQSE